MENKKIKDEFKGAILMNSKIKRLVVDDITIDQFLFISKMGFSHIFEDKPLNMFHPDYSEEKVVKKSSKKTRTIKINTKK